MYKASDNNLKTAYLLDEHRPGTVFNGDTHKRNLTCELQNNVAAVNAKREFKKKFVPMSTFSS